jgi:hypothetical protein
MGLLLRRGLEADRLSFTPAEGELIYVTDTKLVYIGDGVTAGGNLLTGGGEPPPPTPTYQLTRTAASINEGASVTITLTTTNVSNGTSVPYTITGVSSSDINGAGLTGNFTVNSNTAQVVIVSTADSTTEGDEVLTLTLDAISPTKSITVTIVDSSISPGGDIDGGSPSTTVFTEILDGGGPSTTVFTEIIDGGVPA